MQGLSINNLNAGYSKKRVINNFTLKLLPKGKIITLLGPNGCGKSTLMRALAGLNKSSGEIYLNDDDITKLPFSDRSKKVVYLPQTLPAGVHLLVIESVMIAYKTVNTKDENIKENVLNILNQLGIEHLAFNYLDELSGGQKQLVGLAQSLVRNPDILLLDEPLSALDINHQFHVMNLVKQETIRRGMVTIIVVHDLNIALRHSDYIVMIKEGTLIAQGTPFDVISPENLSVVYSIKGRVESCSMGYPYVVVDDIIQ